MLDLTQIELTVEKESPNYGKFIIEPLDQGYGHTIGNSLRRVLLTSLSGGAITQIKINGVKHQFSSLPGMAEDIVEFILNLKKVKIKISSDKPAKLTLDVKGPKEIKAGDIIPSAGVEIVNPDLVLAHLSDAKSKLTATLTAENGDGYSLATERSSSEIGVIPIDANFSPIVKVDYKVEATRVGRLTNFDKLMIEVETDGSIKPSEAIKQASKILVEHFSTISEPQKAPKKEKIEEEKTTVGEEVLNTSLEELDLPVRLINSLKAGKVVTIGDFLTKDQRDLIKMKNMGPKSIDLVIEKLKERGVEIK